MIKTDAFITIVIITAIAAIIRGFMGVVKTWAVIIAICVIVSLISKFLDTSIGRLTKKAIEVILCGIFLIPLIGAIVLGPMILFEPNIFTVAWAAFAAFIVVDEVRHPRKGFGGCNVNSDDWENVEAGSGGEVRRDIFGKIIPDFGDYEVIKHYKYPILIGGYEYVDIQITRSGWTIL